MGCLEGGAGSNMDLRDARQGQKQGVGTAGVEGIPPAHQQRGVAEEVREEAAEVLRRQPRHQDQFDRVDGLLGSHAGILGTD